MQSFSSSSTTYYPLEMYGVTTETAPQDGALAALKNHKEAEKRRRERINSHLNRLRSLLPCNSKVCFGFFFWVSSTSVEPLRTCLLAYMGVLEVGIEKSLNMLFFF